MYKKFIMDRISEDLSVFEDADVAVGFASGKELVIKVVTNSFENIDPDERIHIVYMAISEDIRSELSKFNVVFSLCSEDEIDDLKL